jgi:hypothetical protein
MSIVRGPPDFVECPLKSQCENVKTNKYTWFSLRYNSFEYLASHLRGSVHGLSPEAASKLAEDTVRKHLNTYNLLNSKYSSTSKFREALIGEQASIDVLKTDGDDGDGECASAKVQSICAFSKMEGLVVNCSLIPLLLSRPTLTLPLSRPTFVQLFPCCGRGASASCQFLYRN